MADCQSYPVRGGPQYFSNAHNFIIQNLTFENITPDMLSSALKWLGKRVMPAGVGKSAIIQSLAESESKSSGVIATLFFSTINARNDPNRVFTTLAYQLAIKDPSYRAYVVELMSQDPQSLDKATSEQFRKLFIEPFAQRGIGGDSAPWLILLDGLDECIPPDAGPQAVSSLECAQCEIIKLISTFVVEHPSILVLWIISSHPESHLRAFFSCPNVGASHWEEEIPIDSDEACQDMERYLRREFENIHQQYPYHVSSASPWPLKEHISMITRSALGHFIFAATIMKFIEDPDIGNPITQLGQILTIIDHPGVRIENPLAALYALYMRILQQINPTILPLTKCLLGYYLWAYNWRPGAHSSLLIVACNILNLKQDRAYSALRKLHTVLRIPHPADADEKRLKFLHKSFVDYLRGSHQFSIGAADIMVGPWLCGIRVLGEAVVPYKPTSDISNISLCWCPLEKSVQVQLQWWVYATAAHLFGWLVDYAKEELVLDNLQSIDFSKIIGGYLILGMRSSIYFNFFESSISNITLFDSNGLARSINLRDVDTKRIRNDKLAYYGICYIAMSGNTIYYPAGCPIFFQDPDVKDVLQDYRFTPHVNELLHLDLPNPIGQPCPPLSALLDRL
ncbi:hypothetical protein P691DRAFT_774397 [Macrolepiota fuliginosa MF-IS2]|uniref:Nephrocystin 3-like N-terminal domain-containing protein n=1 Tax=Macrolepiota fuliginosa MF-IS2 TaxID=1400762 RepID=A0A9P5XHT8_9AGAR|nr:hypothetical protein P691DRAFT_774397 [Macrolepiota fuliginosa MF-IS2]